LTSGAEWAARVGQIWADEWRRTDRTFASLQRQLERAIDAAAPPGAAVLDIGCGAGTTSLSLAARRPDLTISGIDISPQLIATATQRSTGLTNLRFAVGDASAPAGARSYDLLISRHGVMFFDDPQQAFAHLRARAREDGRLVFSCMRAIEHNAWANDLVSAVIGGPPPKRVGYAPGPFSLADPVFTADLLRAAGWTNAEATIADYEYVAGEGDEAVEDAVHTFRMIGPAASLIAAADENQRPEMIERLRSVVGRYHEAERVAFPASAWIWTASA